MGNELSGSRGGGNDDDEVTRAYDNLNTAIGRGDLDAVKRYIEVDDLSPNGAPGGSGWEHPLLGACVNASNDGGKDLHIARYLHSKGARGYGIATAAQMGDLERIKELVDSKEEELAAGRACRLIPQCWQVEIARWLFDYAGADSNREEAYHITIACRLGDLERVKAIATATPGFDINTGYLKPMAGCGDDIVPYTTDAEREKLNEQLIKTYRRTCDTTCTQLLYPLEVVCIQQHPFQPKVAAYLINELGADIEILTETSSGSDRILLTLSAIAINLSRMDVLDFLSKHGAKAPWKGGGEAAAKCLLDAASSKEGTEMLQFLLDDEERAKCFDLTCTDKFGRTPLNRACVFEREENVKYLLGHGGAGATAIISPKDIRAACEKSNSTILTLLMNHGGVLPPNNEVVTMISFTDDDRALAVLKLLHSRSIDLVAPFAKTQDGTTYNFFALHDATMHGAISCIEFLLSIGADPNAIGCSSNHQKPGLADDWKGNLDLQYGNVYGDGINLIMSKVNPVKALFERAREDGKKQGGGNNNNENTAGTTKITGEKTGTQGRPNTGNKQRKKRRS